MITAIAHFQNVKQLGSFLAVLSVLLLHAVESSLFGAARYAVELSLAVVTDPWSCFCIFVCLKILSHQISEIRLRTPMSASASSCLMICHLRILFLVRFLLFLFYCIAGFAFIGVYNVKVTLGIFGFALWL
jgi:hypothetical protein